ncbi:hypothetical protein [Mycolicibacterium thermoresistibile]
MIDRRSAARMPVLTRLLVPGGGAPLVGCATSITEAVWPGAAIERVVPTAADVPPGVYFENVGAMSVSGPVLPMRDDTVAVKAVLPQTFLEVVTRQDDRVETV